jgi:hypothetical protein
MGFYFAKKKFLKKKKKKKKKRRRRKNKQKHDMCKTRIQQGFVAKEKQNNVKSKKHTKN